MSKPSTHEDFTRPEEIARSSDRSFGLVFTALFFLLGVWPVTHRAPMRPWALGLSAVLLILSLTRPTMLATLNHLWFTFGLLLQRIASPVVLGFLFFVVVTPLGVVMRCFAKNPLDLSFDHEVRTYWIERRPPGPASNTMGRQF